MALLVTLGERGWSLHGTSWVRGILGFMREMTRGREKVREREKERQRHRQIERQTERLRERELAFQATSEAFSPSCFEVLSRSSTVLGDALFCFTLCFNTAKARGQIILFRQQIDT